MASQELDPRLESEVLKRSGRRCCLCFVFNDLQVKKGKIIHLDGNPQNNTFQNLAFLCWQHSAQYNAQIEQKSLTIQQVTNLRDRLYETRDELRPIRFMLVVFAVGMLLGLCSMIILPLIPASPVLSSIRSVGDGLFPVLLLGTGFILVKAALLDPDSSFEKYRFFGANRAGGWMTTSEMRNQVLVWGAIFFLLGIVSLKFTFRIG